MKASRMTVAGLLVASNATALVVGLNVGSTAAPHAAGQRSAASFGLMRAAEVSASSTIGTFVAGRPREVIPSGQAIWSVKVKPGLYEVSFKAILSLTQPDATHPGQVICGALDLATFNQNPLPWIYTVATADDWGLLPAAMSGSATVPVRPGARPGVLCISPTGSYRLLQPLVVTFTKVTSRRVSRAHGIPLTAKSRRALARLIGS